MLKIDQVGKAGWFNTRVTVIATAPMRVEEQRLRPDNLHVARVEHWELDIAEGEGFELALAKESRPAVGDHLQLEVVMRDRPFKARWRKAGSF